MFDGLLALTDVSGAQGFLLASLSAFAAGLIIAFAYMFRSVYTCGFAVTLALLYLRITLDSTTPSSAQTDGGVFLYSLPHLAWGTIQKSPTYKLWGRRK